MRLHPLGIARSAARLRLVLVALVTLAVLNPVPGARAQVSAPAPTAPNAQGLPWWFVKHRYMPGMPWFHRPPAGSPYSRPCRIVQYQPVRLWSTDRWGNTVTWVDHVPRYVCD
jgi:hypothetical protein